MIPLFGETGLLPAGIHSATWAEFESRFGGTPHRNRLVRGLRSALKSLQTAGCKTAYIDGSFVTAKDVPADFDACWDIDNVNVAVLDPVFLRFDHRRAAQKAKYSGEFFPAQIQNGSTGLTFLDFFQVDKDTGGPKGIVSLDLRRL